LLTDMKVLGKMVTVFSILINLYFIIISGPCDDSKKILFDLKLLICVFGGMCVMLYFFP
jgi:hypothetical protein